MDKRRKRELPPVISNDEAWAMAIAKRRAEGQMIDGDPANIGQGKAPGKEEATPLGILGILKVLFSP